MKPAKRDIDLDAKSHAGQHGDFDVVWIDIHTKELWVATCNEGWWVVTKDEYIGPFHTSQAAFGAAKDAIDQLIAEGK